MRINDLTASHGSLVPKQMKIVGVIFCLTIVLSPIGLFILFAEEGAQFKPKEKLYRHYSGIWGLKFGKWKSYAGYTDMALLSQRVSATGYFQGVIPLTQEGMAYDLYLLTPNHRNKIVAYVFNNKIDVENANPELIAKQLGVKFTNFAPKMSEQTLARRRK